MRSGEQCRRGDDGGRLGHWALAVLLCCLLGGAPTSARAGSILGSEGLGLRRTGYDFAARGAGSTAIGVVDPYQMSTENPAALGWTKRPQVYSGLFGESIWIRTSDSGSSDRVGGTRFVGVRVAVPLPGRLRWAAGFGDLTDGRYSLDVQRNVGRPDEYIRRAEGTGGVGQLYTDLAFPVRDLASIGIRVGWIGGTLREVREDIFTDVEFTDTESVLRTRLEDGRSFVLGAQLRPLSRVALGGFVGWGNEARLKSLFRSPSGVSTEERLRFELPPSLGVGLSVQATSRWELAFDYRETRWSESSTSGGSPSGGTSLDRLADDRHFGFGLRRLASEEPRARMGARTVWRAGFRWDELGLPERTEPIREWAVTGGVGLPIQLDRGYIDGLLEIGRRGDQQTVGVRETFLRMGVGVTFQELRSAF